MWFEETFEISKHSITRGGPAKPSSSPSSARSSVGFTVLGTVPKPCAAAALSDLLYSLDENPIAQPF